MSAARSKPTLAAHPWEFKARFRRRAFGWRWQPAIARIKEAVAEIRKVAKSDPVQAGEGAVLLLERLSPALEQVDSSSGAIGTAVNRAIETVVPIVAAAPADEATRQGWLERLYQAHEADRIPYIEVLAEYWGELCASPEVASAWADQLVGIARMALSPDPNLRGFYHGTSMCLSALYRAGRFDELVAIVPESALWVYRRWVARSLAALGRPDEAVRFAESCRSPWASDHQIDAFCEEVLLAQGRVDDAYAGYGLRANRAGTYLATFRAVAKKYPGKDPAAVLSDLAATTPGDEGKWFAAAKDAGLLREALELASKSPCDPRTLARAARDHLTSNPGFAVGAGILALQWLALGYGFDITPADVRETYRATLAAATRLGDEAWVKERVRALATGESLVALALRRELGG